MTNIPLFSGEVSLYDDVDEGLRVECSELLVELLRKCLTSAGFRCARYQAKIVGTPRIHNWVEFEVSDGDFQKLLQTASACLRNAGVTIAEESFSYPGEQHVRLNLTNISVFDK